LTGTPESALSGFASVNSDFTPKPAESSEPTTSVNRLNGKPTQVERNVLIPLPEAAASRASQDQAIGIFADEFA
jgi:hypothetical protein